MFGVVRGKGKCWQTTGDTLHEKEKRREKEDLAGYGDFHPSTTAGRIMSMMYAAVGIPLVFTILTDWGESFERRDSSGFLYFTWIEAGWNWLNSTLFESKAKKDLERRRERERCGLL